MGGQRVCWLTPLSILCVCVCVGGGGGGGRPPLPTPMQFWHVIYVILRVKLIRVHHIFGIFFAAYNLSKRDWVQ